MTYNRYTVKVDSYPMDGKRIRHIARMERGVAYGLRIGAAVLSFILMIAAGVASIVLTVIRSPHMGGELFFAPALLIAFYWGYQAGVGKKKGGKRR